MREWESSSSGGLCALFCRVDAFMHVCAMASILRYENILYVCERERDGGRSREGENLGRGHEIRERETRDMNNTTEQRHQAIFLR